MPEERVELPSFLLADLYKDNLVILDNEVPSSRIEKTVSEPVQPQAELIQSPGKMYLGENRKNIVILVNDQEHEFLEEGSLKLLTTMLAACKLGLNDVAIVNTARVTDPYTTLHATFNGDNYILFGISASDLDLPFAFPYYQVQQYNNCKFLSSPPLQLLNADTVTARTEKSKLWVCLKQLFNV